MGSPHAAVRLTQQPRLGDNHQISPQGLVLDGVDRFGAEGGSTFTTPTNYGDTATLLRLARSRTAAGSTQLLGGGHPSPVALPDNLLWPPTEVVASNSQATATCALKPCVGSESHPTRLQATSKQRRNLPPLDRPDVASQNGIAAVPGLLTNDPCGQRCHRRR